MRSFGDLKQPSFSGKDKQQLSRSILLTIPAPPVRILVSCNVPLKSRSSLGPLRSPALNEMNLKNHLCTLCMVKGRIVHPARSQRLPKVVMLCICEKRPLWNKVVTVWDKGPDGRLPSWSFKRQLVDKAGF